MLQSYSTTNPLTPQPHEKEGDIYDAAVLLLSSLLHLLFSLFTGAGHPQEDPLMSSWSCTRFSFCHCLVG